MEGSPRQNRCLRDHEQASGGRRAKSSRTRVSRVSELDLEGQLNEYEDRKAMGSTVLALSIG
jgi:hypothetical protein